jgi:hypothetical protein
MTPAILLAATLVLAQRGALNSAEMPPPNPVTGRELADRLRSAAPETRADFTGLLKVRDRDGVTTVIPVVGQVIPGEPTWKVIYEVRPTNSVPAEKLIVVHSTNAPNQYFHAKAGTAGRNAGEPALLQPGQVATSLAGTDFWLLDLGLDFLHWPTQRLLKTEMRKGRVCQVLESTQPQPAAGGYGRVVSWLDKETGGPLLAEAYDRDGKLMKEFSIKSFKKVEGRWELEEMEIRDVIRRSRTRLEFTFPEVQAR